MYVGWMIDGTIDGCGMGVCCLDGWMVVWGGNVWVYVCWMDGCMDGGLLDEWMVGCLDAWMDG